MGLRSSSLPTWRPVQFSLALLVTALGCASGSGGGERRSDAAEVACIGDEYVTRCDLFGGSSDGGFVCCSVACFEARGRPYAYCWGVSGEYWSAEVPDRWIDLVSCNERCGVIMGPEERGKADKVDRR